MKKDTNTKTENKSLVKVVGQSTTGPPTLKIDWDLFGELLVDSNLSDEEKREVIIAYWAVVVGFVDLGFGLHPAQLVNDDNCEQNGSNSKSKPSIVIDYLQATKPNIKTSTPPKSISGQERNAYDNTTN